MKNNLKIILILFAMIFSRSTMGQDSSVAAKLFGMPEKLFTKVEHRAASIDRLVRKKEQRMLKTLARQENILRKKLSRKNPAAAAEIFKSDSVYQQIAAAGSRVEGETVAPGNYMPYVDTQTTSFNFITIQQGASAGKAKDAAAQVTETAKKLGNARQVTSLIEERKKYLQEQLSSHGLGKELDKYKEQLYYYKAQMKEYQQLLTSPSKIEEKALSLLRESSAFNNFFQNNSQLSRLFGLPSGANVAPVRLAGLTTRADLQQGLFQRFGTMNLPQQVQEQLAGAQTALKQLKDKAEELSNKPGEADIPDFKPNNQKTKRFTDRLEFGTNLQSTKSNGILPAASDFGVSLGYKLNDRSIAGVGMSYKMGWGQDIRHIRISHQGLGARTFAEYKMKGSFWFSGGFEMNYQSAFNSVDVLRDLSPWQQSVLAGITKKYSLGSKMKGNLQLLYDFLHNKQQPRTQPVIFRFGYRFK